jgi:hypothetical protein
MARREMRVRTMVSGEPPSSGMSVAEVCFTKPVGHDGGNLLQAWAADERTLHDGQDIVVKAGLDDGPTDVAVPDEARIGALVQRDFDVGLGEDVGAGAPRSRCLVLQRPGDVGVVGAVVAVPEFADDFADDFGVEAQARGLVGLGSGEEVRRGRRVHGGRGDGEGGAGDVGDFGDVVERGDSLTRRVLGDDGALFNGRLGFRRVVYGDEGREALLARG